MNRTARPATGRGTPFVSFVTFAPFVLLATAASVASAQSAPPELTAPVNDFAGVIDADDEARLDDLIRKLQAATGDTMVAATIKTFKPEADIRTYANKMFENHGRGIGQKGKDNGLLLLLAVDDREVWTEVGYDLEGIITDGFAGETSRETMVPFFRTSAFGGGLVAGTTVFAQRIASARGVTLDGVEAQQPVRSNDEGGFPAILILFFAIIIINTIRGSINAMRGGRQSRRRWWTSSVGPFGSGYRGGGWSGRGWRGGGGGFGGGFGGFGGGRSGGGGGGAGW